MLKKSKPILTAWKEMVDLAAKENIVIYPIGVGERREVDEVTLGKIAKDTGGEYTYIGDLRALSEPLEELVKMEEFISAANLDIVLSQNADAILDHSSVVVWHSEGITSTRKDYFEIGSPKFILDKGIRVEFDAFTPKEGNITAGFVDIYYTDEEGVRGKPMRIPILTSAETKTPKKSIWGIYGGIFFISMLIFVGLTILFYIKNGNLKKKNEDKIRSVKNYLDMSRGKKMDDLIIGEIKRKMR